MILTCGPDHDKRILDISLPSEKKKIGIFVSGGIDSALLYFLLMLENKLLGNIHEIIPFSIQRKEGSKNFARLTTAYVQEIFNLPYSEPIWTGDTSLPEDQQVGSGILKALLDFQVDLCYTGLIEQLPQHMVGWQPIPFTENEKFRAPFKHLNKSHIISLVYQFHRESLFHVSHSCSTQEVGRCKVCNGCKERQWGFDIVGKSDPGSI